MKPILAAAALALLTACASFSGTGLKPGLSTAAEVEATMGKPALRRTAPNGETVLWYPRMPYGPGNYAARLDPNGKLIAIEQRITEENIARLERGKSTANDVLDIVGPPYRVNQFPRMDREIWTYKMTGFPEWKALFVQMSPDRVVREVYYMDDPEIPKMPSGGRTP